MREGKKKRGGAFKAPPPPDRIGLKHDQINLAHLFSIKNSIGKDLIIAGNRLQ